MTKLPPCDLDAERAALGCILIDPATLDNVRDAIASPEDFFDLRHAAVYQAMLSLSEAGQPIDATTVAGRLLDMEAHDRIGWGLYQIEVIDSVPGTASVDYYASRVAEKALVRRLIERQEAALNALYSGEANSRQHIDSAVTTLLDMRPADHTTEAKLAEWVDEAMEDDKPRIASGMRALDDIVGGFEAGTMAIVGARPAMGKAQPLDAKVLTEAGFVRMGDLEVGDRLASTDGAESVVTGIFPQGRLAINRVTFSDGRSTECCDEHLWSVMYRDWQSPRVVTTARLRDMLGLKRYRNRLYIDRFSGEFGINRMLPIDPWLLGFLIGDGCLTGTSIRFSTSCQATVDRVRQTVGSLHRVTHVSGCDYRVVTSQPRGFDGRFPTTPLAQALRRLGLWGKKSYEKWIPALYLTATREQRAELLCGLMDSDGWVEKQGTMMYGTTSERLARDVVSLVRSLGGYCKESTKSPTYTYKGERRAGRTFYLQSIHLDNPRLFCKCPAKLARIPDQVKRHRRLNVVSVDPAGHAEAQCIAVSHPSHLYITDDYTVTHNTAFGVSAGLNMAETGVPVGFISAEMKARRIARRFVCASERISTRDFEKDKHSPAMQGSIEAVRDLPLWIDETPGVHVDKVCSRIRRWVREHSIKAAFIDYVQLIRGNGDGQYERITNVCQQLQALSREVDIALVVLAQVNRNNTERRNKRPTMADLKGSGELEQAADYILLLHREGYYSDMHDTDTGKARDDEAEIIVAKNRDGETGTAHVGWIGPCGLFTSGVVGAQKIPAFAGTGGDL